MVNSKGKSIVIRPGVRLYKQKRSPYWWASVRMDGEEVRKSTGVSVEAEAVRIAQELAAEIKVKLQHGISLKAIPLFKDIATEVVHGLESSKYSKANDVSVIRAINLYLLPCLGSHPINKVGRAEIHSFYEWRRQKTGAEISPTQRSNTNIALKKIFDLACDLGHIRQIDIPTLPKPSIKKSVPRDYFKSAEIKKIFSTKNFESFIEAARNKKSRVYRQIFPYYITFLFLTGARPGEESAKLKYGDFKFVKHKNQSRCVATISKGKTMGYSPGRDIFVDDLAIKALRHPASFSSVHAGLDNLKALAKEYPDDYVFYAYIEGLKPKLPDYVRVMEQYMAHLGMADKRHVLYSFRHSYITYKLLADVKAYDIAKQCGTSEAMIEQFYDHVRPLQKADNLKFNDIVSGQTMESWLLKN